MRAPERAAAPPPPPPPPLPSNANADQNLAEMAQRLEAALRRPGAEPLAPSATPEPAPNRPATRGEAPIVPPPAAPQKSTFENLEDEMASLLGRPKSSSSS
jgi:flagellar protein FliO/FliZ